MDIALYCREPELIQEIGEALDQARAAGVVLEVEVRWKPKLERSSQIHSFEVDPSQVDQPGQVLRLLEKKLKASPGFEAGAGQLRVNLRKRGDTVTHFGSFTRALLDEDEEALSGGTDGAMLRMLERVFNRVLDANVQHSNGNAQMMGAGAAMVQAMNPKWDPNSPWALLAPMMPALAAKMLGGAPPRPQQGAVINGQVSAAPGPAAPGGAGQAPMHQLPPGASQQGLPFHTEDGAPAPAPAAAPQLPAGQPDPAAIQAWAEANPLDAMQLVARLAKQNGIPPEQLAAAIQGMQQ